MAKIVMLKHKDSGVIKKGFFGFSWTTLFFGMFPSLFRSDFLTFIGGFVVLVILGLFSFGIASGLAMLIWAFFYNGYYTRRLLEHGYVMADAEPVVNEARMRLGVATA